MREQFGLKPKDIGNLYRHPYPEWFERVPLPARYKVPDFSKFGKGMMNLCRITFRGLERRGIGATAWL